MPSSWVNTEYNIHQVQHHPKIDSLPLPASFPLPACFPLPASFPSVGGCCCTQLSTFPQSQVNQWIESQLLSRLAPNRPLPSTPPISLDHTLQVHLQTRFIPASKCISECTRSWPPSASPNLFDHGRGVYLWIHSILDTKCVSEFTHSRPPSASLNSLDHGLRVHVQWATAGVQRYRGNGGGRSHREYIFRRRIVISSGSTQLRGFSRLGSIISSHFLPRLLELEPFFLKNSIWMSREVWRNVNGGLTAVDVYM